VTSHGPIGAEAVHALGEGRLRRRHVELEFARADVVEDRVARHRCQGVRPQQRQHPGRLAGGDRPVQVAQHRLQVDDATVDDRSNAAAIP
jgi:hypothetical protein